MQLMNKIKTIIMQIMQTPFVKIKVKIRITARIN